MVPSSPDVTADPLSGAGARQDTTQERYAQLVEHEIVLSQILAVSSIRAVTTTLPAEFIAASSVVHAMTGWG